MDCSSASRSASTYKQLRELLSSSRRACRCPATTHRWIVRRCVPARTASCSRIHLGAGELSQSRECMPPLYRALPACATCASPDVSDSACRACRETVGKSRQAWFRPDRHDNRTVIHCQAWAALTSIHIIITTPGISTPIRLLQNPPRAFSVPSHAYSAFPTPLR